MAEPVRSLVTVASQQLHVLSDTFRLYVGLSRDGSYLHVVSPRQAEVVDADGTVIHAKGELACTCAGGTFHGNCYRLRQAEAYEKSEAIEDAWFGMPGPASAAEVRHERLTYGLDSPAGAGEMVEASRG